MVDLNANVSGSLDLLGVGKTAEAIPAEVYARSAETVLKTFESLVAPITETTAGFGRYIRQKFDNMVDVEKALATYALEKACHRASQRAKLEGRTTAIPTRPKSFIRCLDEASKETDSTLHEFWTNLLASQMGDGFCHPHFVETLTHFGPLEANLLSSIRELRRVGENQGGYFRLSSDWRPNWILGTDDLQPKKWTISCSLLIDFGFACIVGPKDQERKNTPIFCRTAMGNAFLKAVSNPIEGIEFS